MEGIIASVFLIIVTIIGAYFPYLAAEFSQSHNPYLVLEAAGFLTYSTSEPGNIVIAIPMTQFADPILEFRIIPPISTGYIFSSYDNNDFLISLGYCVEYNLYKQLALDALNGLLTAAFSTVPGVKALGTGLVNGLFSDSLLQIGKFAGQTFVANAGFLFSLNLIQGEQIYGNNIVQNIYSSSISAFQQSLLITGENVGETVLDSVIFAAVATGPIGFGIAVAANFAINAAITFIQYENIESNEYAHCYHYDAGSGNYFAYNNLITLPVYYNPYFDIYNSCSLPELCNTSKSSVAYNFSDQSNDYIIKIEMGYYNSTTNEYYFPLFLILEKLEGNPFGYINVSIVYQIKR